VAVDRFKASGRGETKGQSKTVPRAKEKSICVSITTNTITNSQKGKLHHSWPSMITITNNCKQYNKNNINKQKTYE